VAAETDHIVALLELQAKQTQVAAVVVALLLVLVQLVQVDLAS
jgi:hypothetical protein